MKTNRINDPLSFANNIRYFSLHQFFFKNAHSTGLQHSINMPGNPLTIEIQVSRQHISPGLPGNKKDKAFSLES